MLQILTGRFFKDGKINEMDCDGVLYSNLSWNSPIITPVAEIRPVGFAARPARQFVIRYKNRYEQSSTKDPLHLPIAIEAVEHLRLFLSFYFEAYFHADRQYLENLCRTAARHTSEELIPSTFVRRFFDVVREVPKPVVDGFTPFLIDALSVPRVKYRTLVNCLQALCDSLEAVGANFDLAYSMLVYMLETLSASVDQPDVTWEDFDQNVRPRLDEQFNAIDNNRSDTIKAILLENKHLKLMKRFILFVSDHLSDSYFTSEADGLKMALVKSELPRALMNLYGARSGYVHELKPLPDHLKFDWVARDTDVHSESGEPHLTFAGLVRLARHVLTNFIARQPKAEKEDTDVWRSQLPGVVQVFMSPEYWIWKIEGFSAEAAASRFSGLVMHRIAHPEAAIPMMEPIMKYIEANLSKAKPGFKRHMLALYWLYNVSLRQEFQIEGWINFMLSNESILRKCEIEFVVVQILGRIDMMWEAQEVSEAFEQYQKSRYKAKATQLPRIAELAVMATIANLYAKQGDNAAYQRWVNRAILDAAGRREIREHIQTCASNGMPLDAQLILGGKSLSTAEVDIGSREVGC